MSIASAAGKLTPDTQASASMLPALLGISPFATPNDCLLDAFNALDGKARSFDYIEPAEWGNKFENHILVEASQRLNINVDYEINEPFQHTNLPLGCSLDAIGKGIGDTVYTDKKKGIYVLNSDSIVLDGVGVLEAKLTSAVPSADGPPDFRGPIQIQAQMMCTGYKWGAICTLYRGTELRIYLTKIEPSIVSKITADVLEFQTRIDKYKNCGDRDFYPALQPNDAVKTWPLIDAGDQPVELPNELSDLAVEYDACLQAESAIRKQKAAITTELQNFMGNSEKALIFEDGQNIGFVTWPMNKSRKEYTVNARPASRSKAIKVRLNDLK